MSVYALISYDINDPEGYQPYVPAVVELLGKHGAEVVVADWDANVMEGEKKSVHVVLRFPSEEAALAWYNDPAYVPVKQIRLNSCSNGSLVFAKPFVPPSS